MKCMTPIIQIENLCKTYENEGVKTQAVCGVSLTIQKGEFVAIMGPSGSGKSTLMQMLGFLDRLTEGKYFFEGENTADFSEEKLAYIRNQKIGFVFQTFNLLPRTTVFENVELPLLYDRGEIDDKDVQNKVEQALKAVSMEHRINYFSNQLSGGEKQRVAMARALVNNPDVIFADEPTGNLDSKSGVQIMKILQELNEEGHTIILVTHETFTAQHAKRIVYIRDGQLEADDLVKDRKIAKEGEKLK
jgi:putative ABC transport system ATP-binding protein